MLFARRILSCLDLEDVASMKVVYAFMYGKMLLATLVLLTVTTSKAGRLDFA